MKYLNSQQGLGLIRVNLQEAELIQELFDLVGNQYKYTIGQKNDQTVRYGEIVNNLLEEGFLQGILTNKPLHRTNDSYFSEHNAEEILIPSRLPIAREGQDTSVALRIIKAEQFSIDYLMSIVLDSSYRPDCVDDLARVLGKREKPELAGIEILPDINGRNTEYGFSEVPSWRKILAIYQKATNLAAIAGGSIKITKDELNILREDSMHHRNVAVRKLSKKEYDFALQNLTHNF